MAPPSHPHLLAVRAGCPTRSVARDVVPYRFAPADCDARTANIDHRRREQAHVRSGRRRTDHRGPRGRSASSCRQSRGSAWRRRMGLDHRPSIFGQMSGQVLQGSGSSQLLTDLGHRGVGGIAARPSVAGQRPITGVEVHHHVAVVLVLARLEPECPYVWLKALHGSTIAPPPPRRQGRTSLRCPHQVCVGFPVGRPTGNPTQT